MSTPLPPAGWYPDPTSSAHQRWWDGGRWTDFSQPSTPLPFERAGGVATAPGVPASALTIAAATANAPLAELAPPTVPGLTTSAASQPRQSSARVGRRRSLWRPAAR
jgi:hypothetical protein